MTLKDLHNLIGRILVEEPSRSTDECLTLLELHRSVKAYRMDELVLNRVNLTKQGVEQSRYCTILLSVERQELTINELATIRIKDAIKRSRQTEFNRRFGNDNKPGAVGNPQHVA